MRLAWNDDSVHVGDEAHHVPRLDARHIVIREIAAHPRAKSLCLSDIQRASFLVLPEIDARSFGQMWELGCYCIGHGEHLRIIPLPGSAVAYGVAGFPERRISREIRPHISRASGIPCTAV